MHNCVRLSLYSVGQIVNLRKALQKHGEGSFKADALCLIVPFYDFPGRYIFEFFDQPFRCEELQKALLQQLHGPYSC